MKRWLRRILFGALIVVAIAAAGIAWAVTTTSGASALLRLADRFAPGELVATGVDGSLAGGLRLRALRYRAADIDVAIEALALDLDVGALAGRHVWVRSLELNSVRISTADKPPGDAGPLELPEIHLPVSIDVDRLQVGVVSVQTTAGARRIERLTAAAAWRDDLLQLRSLSLQFDDLTLATEGRLRFSEPYDHALKADWEYAGRPLRGNGSLTGTLDATELVHTLFLPERVNLVARLEPRAADGMRIDAGLELDASTLPAHGIAAGSGRLKLAGTSQQFRLDLSASVEHVDYGPIAAEAVAAGSPEQLTLHKLDARLFGGTATLAGVVGLADGDWFAGSVDLQSLDAAQLVTGIAGTLSLRGNATVTRAGELRLGVDSLSGKLNGQKLTGAGALAYAGQRLELSKLRIRAGANKVSVDGSIADDLADLRFGIEAPQTEDLWPDLRGAVDARGSLRGSLRGPLPDLRVDARIEARALKYRDLAVANITASVTPDKDRRSRIQLTAAGLESASRALGDLELSGVTDWQTLAAQLDWSLADTAASVGFELARTDRGVKGRVDRGAVDSAVAGGWRLDEPFDFAAAGDGFSVGPHCWRDAAAQMCVRDLSWSDAGRQVRAVASGLPLALFNPFLPSELMLAGRADAEADLTWEGEAMRGNLAWRQHDTVLRVAAGGGEAWTIQFDTLRLTANGSDAALDIEALARSGDDILLDARLQLGALSQSGPVAGAVNLRLEDVAPLAFAVPQLGGVKGVLSVQADIGGTLGSPRIDGRASLRDGRATLRPTGAVIDDARVDAVFDAAGNLQVEGELHSGEGSLRVEGSGTDLFAEARSITVTMTGEAFPGMQLPDYTATLSPDLKFAYDSTGAVLNGRIVVPAAQLAPTALPADVTRVSPDAVVHDDSKRKTQRAGPPLTVDLTVALGPEVMVSSLGLDGRLTGQLRLQQTSPSPPRATGVLELVDGKFSAYGQRLSIERGRLIFSGALDDPALDIAAVRQVPAADTDITVGLRIGGTAKRPASSVYSEPPMGEADALAYLLTGQPLVGASDQDVDLAGAAFALGLTQAAPIARQVAGALRLQELGVRGSGDDTRVAAGAKLGSDVYVRYTYGLFTRIAGFLLRYDLNKRFSLEAQTGQDTSLELIYSVER